MNTLPYREWCYQRVCSGKHPYLSELVARNTATALGWRDGRTVAPYRCPYCSTADYPNWHLGTVKDPS